MPDSRPTFQEQARAEELIQFWLEESLDGSGAEELLALLSRYPRLDDWALGHLQSHQMLCDLLAKSSVESAIDQSLALAWTAQPPRSGWKGSFLRALLGSVLLLCVAVGLWGAQRFLGGHREQLAAHAPAEPDLLPIPDPPEESSPAESSAALEAISAPHSSEEQMTDAVAVVSRRLGAASAEESSPVDVGDVLSPGRIELKDGLICLDFFQGARVAFEAPSEFEILSNNRIRLDSGRLYAAIPGSLRNFVIETPQGDVGESAQLMGVSVNAQRTHVHVFEGQVKLRSFEDLRVGQGKAVAFTRRQIQKSAAANAAEFVSVQQLDERYAAAQAARRQQWMTHGSKVNLDPSLVLRFEFSELSDEPVRQLKNQASFSHITSGSIVGCRTTSSGWIGPRTLTFENLTDRVCIDVPDVFEAVTLTAWVRVHVLPDHFAGLLMSDGSPLGGLHWQLTKLGGIRLCYLNDSVKWNKLCELDSPIIPKEELINKWVHLAVTVDAKQQRAAHYLNGRMVIDGPMLMEHDICISQASLGNWWRPSNQQSPIRNLNGDLGEMTLHARALSDEEILAIYQTGSLRNLSELTGAGEGDSSGLPFKMSDPPESPSDSESSHQ